jgi:hypothetical protein
LLRSKRVYVRPHVDMNLAKVIREPQLKQHLLLESEWKLEVDFAPRASVFRKRAEGSQSKEWTEQRFVMNNSQFKLSEIEDRAPSYLVTAWRYLKRGQFSPLRKKIVQKVASLTD